MNIYKKGRNVKYPSYYLKTITHDDIFPLKKLQFEEVRGHTSILHENGRM